MTTNNDQANFFRSLGKANNRMIMTTHNGYLSEEDLLFVSKVEKNFFTHKSYPM